MFLKVVLRISVQSFFLCHWWIFSSLGWLLEQFSGSQAAYGTIFRVLGSYPKHRTIFLKRVSERIVQNHQVFS
jgi:hypothetical protein